MEHDPDMVAAYRANGIAIGRTPDDEHEVTYSTDMGNVSLEMPSIHPSIAIESAGRYNHQPEFAAACINASADRAVLEGSLALVWTAIDLTADHCASGSSRRLTQRRVTCRRPPRSRYRR